MARFAAHFHSPQLTPADAELLVQQIAMLWAAESRWLDCRNASMGFLLPPRGLAVQVLIEFQGASAITLLMTSSEGMGQGVLQTRHCFKQVLLLLQECRPEALLLYRSDRDGPIRQGTLQC